MFQHMLKPTSAASSLQVACLFDTSTYLHTGAWAEASTAAIVDGWVGRSSNRPIVARAAAAALERAAAAPAVAGLFGVLVKCLQVRDGRPRNAQFFAD